MDSRLVTDAIWSNILVTSSYRRRTYRHNQLEIVVFICSCCFLRLLIDNDAEVVVIFNLFVIPDSTHWYLECYVHSFLLMFTFGKILIWIVFVVHLTQNVTILYINKLIIGNVTNSTILENLRLVIFVNDNINSCDV